MFHHGHFSVLLAGTMMTSLSSWLPAHAQDVGQAPQSDGSIHLEKLTVTSGEEDAADKHAGAADRQNSIYVSREELELIDPQSLKEVFAGDASVSVGGGIGASQKVYVNSVDELNLAVTVDGVLQNNRVFHHNTTNYIDPTLLKAVRVDPGVAPADAGPGALGGSIIYETVDVSDLLRDGRDFGGYASLSYITNGETFMPSGAAYGRQDGFELLGYIKYATGDDYSAGDGSTVPGTGADFLSYLGKAAYQSVDGHRFEFKAQQIQDDDLRPYRANIGGLPIGDPETRRYDLMQRNFSFEYGIEGASGLFDPSVVVGYSEAENRIPTYFNRRSGQQLFPNMKGSANTWTAKAENTFHLSETNTITAGVDYYDSTGKYIDDIWLIDGLQESANNFGFYAQARLEPLDRLRLSFGGRGDYQRFKGVDGTTLNNFGLSGNVYAAFDLTDDITVNAGYSNVFGGVDIEEAYLLDALSGYDDLKPVRSQNYVAGIEYNHNGFLLSGSVYQTSFTDYRETSYSLGTHNVDFDVRGFTLGAGYNWGNGFARLSYSNSELKKEGAFVDSYTASEIGMPVGQVIAAQVVHNFAERGVTVGSSVDAALEYDGTSKAGYEKRPAYIVVNAFLEYTPKQFENLTLRFEANNIFDETYADRATYGVEYGLAELTPLYEPGRSFLFKAKVTY